MMEIEKNILAKSRPSREELKTIRAETDRFLSRLSRSLQKNRIDAKPVLGGSSAKGTIIKDDFDCDIFVRFSLTYRGKDISGMLENALSDFNGVERVHGSRDYFNISENSITFEIVPVLNIMRPGEAENVTDMSPLHVDWIMKRLEKNPRLAGEIILAKLFCKAQGVYGAESYISGLSGHVLDILVSYYGSFDKLLENAASWQKYKVIDIEGYGSESSLNRSKISPLIVIDPVDRRRNAAAALSIEKFERFRKAAREYLKNPSAGFFQRMRVTEEGLKTSAGNDRLIMLRAQPERAKTDVAGGKLLKVHKHILRQLEQNDFMVRDAGWDWDSKGPALLWYILDKKPLAPEKLHTGPPLTEKDSVEAFRKKHKGYFDKGGRLHVMLKRRFLRPEELVKELLSQDFIRERVQSIDFQE